MESTALLERTRRYSRKSRFTDAQIEAVARGGRLEIAAWVKSAALQQRVKPYGKVFARAVSCLSDGVVDLDPVEEALVALNRAGLISSRQRGLLQARYLR